MALPSITLITALRSTAKKLDNGSVYHWGHMGACNCGNLAQELLHVGKAEIHSWALETREGDWSEQTAEYCPASNLPMDLMIQKMLNQGLRIEDLQHLEKLSDPEIIRSLPQDERELNYHHKKDVVIYLYAWADLLENKWAETVDISSVYNQNVENLPVECQ